MSFLNAALAIGAFAFAIPLIIHLFFRSRFKKVDWGAMHLLESVVRVNRRRLQLTNLLLLLLRCAIPIILAFCLARPVLTGFQSLAGDAPKTLVVAIDDSRSMSVTPPGEEARIDRAKRQIREVLDDLSRKDEVILVRSSRLGAVPATMGVSDAASALRKVAAVGGDVSVGDLLEAAHDAAASGTHPRRQILLVSDFQSHAVDASSLETARRLIASEENSESVNDVNRPAIDLLNVGGESETLANVSIDTVEVNSPVVVAERSAVYSAVLRNSAELPANDLRLVWSIDGKPLEPRVVSVDAKSTRTNRLTHAIDTPGVHEVSVAIERADVLTADNSRSVAVEVMREINVVLLDGRPSREPLRGQADFLAIALSPFAFGGDDRPDPVRAAVVMERRLAETMDDNEVRVVVLAGVGRLNDDTKARLESFVRAGGSLVVFDGPSFKPELYNGGWKNEDAVMRFPAVLGEIMGNPDADPDDSPESFLIDKPAQMYRPWTLLSRGSENPLGDVNVFAYRDLDVPDEEGAESQDQFVLLQTTEGAPLAVMSRYGEGSLVQFALSGNDAWSNLPLRPAFLPLIQQMVLDLAGKGNDTMFPVGQPIVLAERDWPKLVGEFNENAEPTIVAQTPLGEAELDSEPGEPVRLTATYEPGAYRFEKRIVDFDDPDKTTSVAVMRIAEVAPSESMLVDAQPQRLQSFADTLGATVFTKIDALRDADRTRAFGREIWRWLLAALVIALVAELWLQQNLVARRRAAGGTG